MTDTSVQLDSKFYYRLTTMFRGEEMCLDVVSGGTDNNMTRLSKRGNYSGQYWRIAPSEEPGYFRLSTEFRGQNIDLDVFNGGAKNNYTQLRKKGNYAGQYWQVTPAETAGYVRLSTKCRGDQLNLDVINGGDRDNYTQLAPRGHLSGQYWKLEKTDRRVPTRNKNLDKIEHVVVLMIENRSLDSVLGWLYEDDQPNVNIPAPASGERRFDGLQGLDLKAYTNTAGELSSPPIRGAAGINVPFVDPGESFVHVNTQLFEKAKVSPGDKPTMKGYLADYVKVIRAAGDFDPNIYGKQVMQSYTPAQLPVLNGLAKYYAVCDRWFGSVPSQTNTNRAFSICGTSRGLVDNGYFEEDPRAEPIEKILGEKLGDDRFKTRTIWNALHDSGYDSVDDWMLFWQSPIIPEALHNYGTLIAGLFGEATWQYIRELSSGSLTSCYTYRLFPELAAIPNVASHCQRIEEFHKLARSGKLPRFSYIEPRWNLQQVSAGMDLSQLVKQAFSQTGNDYHPPGNVVPAEEFVRELYLSLTANEEAWKKTLFIITTDEAVGEFDHVPPPAATPPWGSRKPEHGRDLQKELQHDFGFDRYGARVPTILISPYIPRGTVFRSEIAQPYDHTSLIATILKWLGLDAQRGDFGERTLTAPTFEDVFSLDAPRNDARDIPFLKQTRKTGDPIHCYDSFYLQGGSGKFISRAELTGKTSRNDSIQEYFPTLGKQAMAHQFMNSDNRPSTDVIQSGQALKIVTADPLVGAYNVLGAWWGASDCYYYNDYLSGDYNEQETWIIRKVKGDGPIHYGDQVSLTCRHMDWVLAEDGKWVTAHTGARAVWTIVAPPQT